MSFSDKLIHILYNFSNQGMLHELFISKPNIPTIQIWLLLKVDPH